MPLYVRSEAVNELADKLSRLMGTDKTAAVKMALEDAIAKHIGTAPLAQQVAGIQAAARQRGLGPDGLDDKSLMDDLSGDC